MKRGLAFATRGDEVEVFQLAGEGAVEIDHVEVARAVGPEIFRHADRIDAVDRLGVGAALLEPDDLAAAQIDGREDMPDYFAAGTSASVTKFFSICKPAR